MIKYVPNILSSFRLVLVPVFVVAYFSGTKYASLYAACVYGLASFTDFLDGHIARKYNCTSNLGRVLDPLGDKMMTLTVIVCITVDRLIPLWVIFVVAGKELLMGIGGLIIHKKKMPIPPSNYIGKTSTVIFFVVCVILMLFRDIIPAVLSEGLIIFAVCFSLIALGGYVLTFLNVIKKPENGEEVEKTE